ncbi:DUF1638 domain-containing protein [Profundibacterium mesophilum]|uniref:DUF1638 domain-containing protein n=1 Tax=Profundibacterium mesophilum KAUST100406-0324 TaxID=1037889 RepID=A0A921TDS2_9RHOB|nr:DUF1638 domain-containing protein [Profundibacterium mesophilum]KAF0677128.1 hypothetical protein PMES_00443 [Profundibacterium mesophilum KAUST100406-0324]
MRQDRPLSPSASRAARDAAGAPVGPDRLLLVACGALAREIGAVIGGAGWSHVDLICLPAILHNRPEEIPQAVRQAVLDHRAEYARIFVVYADCGTGGRLQSECDALGVEMVQGPHCYAFYEGLEAFAAREECTAFYLTDFLVRQFDAFVIRPLGLDRHPQLRDLYFGNYDRLVYQAQTEDPELTRRAQDCATRLGLTFERRFTGYGNLQDEIVRRAPPG